MAKVGGWGDVLAAGVNGYLQGQRILALQDDQKDRARRRAREDKADAEKDQLRSDLRSASTARNITESGGPVLAGSMDNRDVGQPGEPTLTAAPTDGTGAVAGPYSSSSGGGSSGAGAAAAMTNAAVGAAHDAADQSANIAQASQADLSRQAQAAAASSAAATAGAADADAAAQPDPAAVTPIAVPTSAPAVVAASPAAVPAASPVLASNAAAMPKSYSVDGKAYGDRNAAQTAAEQANTPQAIAARQAGVYQAAGMPEQAALLEQRQAALAKQAEELKQKGVFDALSKFRAGDQAGAVKGLKASGLFDIAPDSDVTMKPVDKDIPGIGTIKTFDMTFQHKTADGKVEPFTINSHDASMALMPYEKQLEVIGKGADRASKADDRADKMDLARERLAMQGELNAARIERMQRVGSGGSSDKQEKEYRLLLQNNVSGISREIRETDAQIKDLTANGIPGKPDPRLADLITERSQLASRRNALNDEFLDLTKKAGGVSVGSSNSSTNLAQASRVPTKDTKYGKAAVVKTKEEYDKLSSGALYIPPNGGEPLRKK